MPQLSRRERLRQSLNLPEVPCVMSKDFSSGSAIPEHDSEAIDEIDLLDDLRQPFVEWFDARAWLDAKAAALRLSPRWCAGVNSLYADCCSWVFDHRQGLVPPTLAEFRHLLRELCFEICIICGEQFVWNIALREDVEAQRRRLR